MNLKSMMESYIGEGLSNEFASARVCQDIVLTAIFIGSLSRNVTIKGGVVMRSITNDNRRSTRDIDLDFIHYSLSEESIRSFIKKMNCIDGIIISIDGAIEELKHQDYHGKSMWIKITDGDGNSVSSKMDIGVHKHLEIEQEEYCFDVCTMDDGVCLLKNTVEQSFAEKLRSLLVFGPNSRRYKDIYDMYYLKDLADRLKLRKVISLLIFDDDEMRENDYSEIISRLEKTFGDKHYLQRVSSSRQRWLDEDIKVIADALLEWIRRLG